MDQPTPAAANKNKILYVLQLEDDCWYVGTTGNLEVRFQKHQQQTACEWTRCHHVVGLFSQEPCSSPLLEDFKTKELMRKYGIDRVRGGSYCQVKLNLRQWKTLNEEFRTADNRCFNCGLEGHFANACPLKLKSKKPKSSRPKKPRCCSRCGRNSHDIRTCHAHTHFDGTSLEGVPYYKKEQEITDDSDDESETILRPKPAPRVITEDKPSPSSVIISKRLVDALPAPKPTAGSCQIM